MRVNIGEYTMKKIHIIFMDDYPSISIHHGKSCLVEIHLTPALGI